MLFDFTTPILSMDSTWTMKKSLMLYERSDHAIRSTRRVWKDRICKDDNELLRIKRILFIYWFKVRWVYKRGQPHNEHLKYPMSTGRGFYPEWAPRPMSLVLSEHTSKSAFPQTSEAWLSQDSVPRILLIDFLFPRPPFQVFNLGILFVVQSPFQVFNLTFIYIYIFISFFMV